MLLGSISIATMSDYGQFYLFDREAGYELDLDAIDWSVDHHRPEKGLVVFVRDCLDMRIDVEIHDREPENERPELYCDLDWTKVAETTASFPSKAFTIGSPSSPTPLPCGPIFLVPSQEVRVRIRWFWPESEDGGETVDVVSLQIWPGDVPMRLPAG